MAKEREWKIKDDVVILSSSFTIYQFAHNVSVYLKTSDGRFTVNIQSSQTDQIIVFTFGTTIFSWP